MIKNINNSCEYDPAFALQKRKVLSAIIKLIFSIININEPKPTTPRPSDAPEGYPPISLHIRCHESRQFPILWFLYTLVLLPKLCYFMVEGTPPITNKFMHKGKFIFIYRTGLEYRILAKNCIRMLLGIKLIISCLTTIFYKPF